MKNKIGVHGISAKELSKVCRDIAKLGMESELSDEQFSFALAVSVAYIQEESGLHFVPEEVNSIARSFKKIIDKKFSELSK